MTDFEFMAEALKEALVVYEKGECPVGAVMVCDEAIIARSGNRELEL